MTQELSERMAEVRMDLLMTIDLFRQTLDSVNPFHTLAAYDREETYPEGGGALTRAQEEQLPRVHRRYLNLYETIFEQTEGLLAEYGRLVKEALVRLNEDTKDDADRRLALQQEIMHAVTVITEAYETINPHDILEEYRKRPAKTKIFKMLIDHMIPQMDMRFMRLQDRDQDFLIELMAMIGRLQRERIQENTLSIRPESPPPGTQAEPEAEKEKNEMKR
jgi:hypothetical protein